MAVYVRLKESKGRDESEKTNSLCELESQSENTQPDYCTTLFNDLHPESSSISCSQDIAEHITSMPPATSAAACSHNSECEVTNIDGQDVTENSDDTSAVIKVCDGDSILEFAGCESTLARSANSVLQETNHQSSPENVSDTSEKVVSDNVQYLTADCSDLHSAADGNLAVTRNCYPILRLSTDLYYSLDSSGCDAESETEPTDGFSDSDAVCSVDDLLDNGELTQAESLTRNDEIITSTVDTVNAREAGSQTSSRAAVVDGESGGKSVARKFILSASLSEVSQPIEETITHIGSTHVHVTHELSIVNGVVQPISAGVKIGNIVSV